MKQWILTLLPFLILSCATLKDLKGVESYAPPDLSGIKTTQEEPFRILPETEQDRANFARFLGDEKLDALIKTMTLKEKIAQHFILWIPRDADEADIKNIKSLNAAGYIIYPWNYTSIAKLKDLTENLCTPAPLESDPLLIKPFICADQEGGRVAAFRFQEFPTLPSAFLLGSLGDPALVEASAYLTALELRYLGVNMNLAPVADLYDQGDDSIIGDRSFGPDPRVTGASVAAYVEGMLRGGIIATVKHFPGHGVTTVDSHIKLPVADISAEKLRNNTLQPFIQGINAGAPVLMTAHVLYPSIDPEHPATLSPLVLQGLLRNELGFQGIILTDGFEMGALANEYGKAESLSKALDAGVNLILLYNSYDPREMMILMEDLYNAGRIDMDLIDRNVRTILAVKSAYGLIESPTESIRMSPEQ